MTEKQFKEYINEQHYINHLDKVMNEVLNVCNRIDCTKYHIPIDDREELRKLVSSFIKNTRDRMDRI